MAMIKQIRKELGAARDILARSYELKMKGGVEALDIVIPSIDKVIEYQRQELNELEDIIKEAIYSLDRGEKVNGLEFALQIIKGMKEEK